MKTSQYNYIIENGEVTVFLNGISEKFFEIPSGNVEVYTEIIQHPNEYSHSFAPFIQKMIDAGFILPDEVDEEIVLERKSNDILSEELFHLMILPTYQCNLRCWYCVQDHQDLWMSEETIYLIKKLLRKKISDSAIKIVKLSWFGGEPLMGYDKIIDISSFAKRECTDAGKQFICEITTNGTLLTKNRIEELRNVGISSYQITIDGDKDTHDSVKVLSNGSAFDKTLEMINIIAESTMCVLRFNYTHESLNPESIIECIKKRIAPQNRSNVSLLLYKVWQEPQELIDDGEVEKMARLSESIGIKARLPICNLCYADGINFNCIFPNGKVEKCDNESPIAAKGKIVDGDIIWTGDITPHTTAFKNPAFPCRKCRYVPICWGPCVSKRTEMLKKYGTGKCQYDDKETEMRRYILNRYRNAKTFR